MKNEMELSFDAVSANEGFARMAVAAFITHLNPTMEELADIKTAVSEAVTNSVIHGYGNMQGCDKKRDLRLSREKECGDKVRIHCILDNEILHIEVADTGKGIENVEQAMEPLFTTCPGEDRSGMGFAFMEAFMDGLEVDSAPGKGTVVRMVKKIGTGSILRQTPQI